MSIAHTLFGQNYNKSFDRKGKIGIERPKTPIIEEKDDVQMKLHMYVEANPLRAKIVKNLEELSNYKFSSYGFYAQGIKNRLSKDLEEPTWYLRLGKCSIERQEKYQNHFKNYLDINGWFGNKERRVNTLKDSGSNKFLSNRRNYFKVVMNIKRKDSSLSPIEILRLYRKKMRVIKNE